MKKLTALILVVAAILTGCGGGGNDDECLTYMVNNDQPITGTSGLTLAPSQNMYMTFPQMEALYNQMKQCVGVNPPVGPTVYYKNFSQNNLGAAWAFQTSMVIWVNNDNVSLIRNCHSDQEALRHEFVHYLLYASGLDLASNADHDSNYFTKCNAVGVNTENGVPH